MKQSNRQRSIRPVRQGVTVALLAIAMCGGGASAQETQGAPEPGIVAPTGRVVSGSSQLRGASHDGQSSTTASSNGLGVTIPNGYATISVDDLRVKTTAGDVSWARAWDGQEWKFNAHWESLSQSWRNLTGSQTADSSGGSGSSAGSAAGSVSTAGSGGGGCWVWVDEDWQASTGTTVIGGIPTAGPLIPERMTPFNRVMGQDAVDYAPPQRVSVDYASLCPGSSVSGASAQDLEAVRRINELYLGEQGRYAFSNRAVLEKRAVKELRPLSDAEWMSVLSAGKFSLQQVDNPKGYRWIDRSGDWIDYNTQGQVVAYGDRNNNVIWLARDASGVVRGVLDGRGRLVLSLHYQDKLLVEVKDYADSTIAADLSARSVQYRYDNKSRLIEVTDARGGITSYAYDALNHLVSVKDQEGHQEQLAYVGDMVKQRTAGDGGVTDYAFEYDDTNKQFISQVTGPETASGRRKEDYTHNRIGQLVRRITNGRIDEEIRYDTGARAVISTNARGGVTRTVNNEFDQTVETVFPDGSVTKRSFAPANLELSSEVDEAGVRIVYEQDSRGNIVRRVEASGLPEQRVTEYVRNALGQVIEMLRKGRVESNGVVTPDSSWKISYDGAGQVSETTDPEGNARQYSYNRIGSLVRYVDPYGNVTTYDVDPYGNLLGTVDALGNRVTYGYDKVGNLVSQIDGRKKTTQVMYDAMNRRIRTLNEVGGTYSVTYNAQSQSILESDEDGRVSKYAYDNFLRLTEHADGLGNVSRFGYQLSEAPDAPLASLGNPSQLWYPTFTQQARFDERERPTAQIISQRNSRGPEILTGSMTYDVRGLMISETDANGKKKTHRYDALRQSVESVDYLGGQTLSRYDVRGNLIELTDPLGNVYAFEYDRSNRLIRETRPGSVITSLRYDRSGNVVEKTDPRGVRTVFTYDAVSRVVLSQRFAASGALVLEVSHEWDANDNLVSWTQVDATRPEGQRTSKAVISFDDAGRKSGETITYPNPQGGTYSLAYQQSHSASGKKTAIVWPDGTKIDYAYSAHGELENVSIPGEGTMSFGDYAWSAPKLTIFPGGATDQKGYDGMLTLESLKVKTPGQQELFSLSQTFGKAQEMLTRTTMNTVGGVSSGVALTYTQDAESRLTAITKDEETETFGLDALGNRTSHSRWPGQWKYDAKSRLVQRGDSACGAAGTVCYSYDDAGNLTGKVEAFRETVYVYDVQGRLSEVRTGQGRIIARYGYDPSDRRLWKEQFVDAAGGVLSPARRTYYLYADEGLLAESEQAITVNADGSYASASDAAITRAYGLRPGAEFTTGVLFTKAKNSRGGTTVAYYHHDHLGVPMVAVDKGGNVVWSARYDAYGRATITTPAATDEQPIIESNLRLPGQYEDAETGLHYNLRRYYDPELGRYVSEDPIGLDGGLNLFLYAGANPLIHADPRGEWWQLPVLFCLRFPRICQALAYCFLHPATCRNTFCKIGNRLYHPLCDFPGCKAGEGCATTKMKLVLAEGCYANRLAVSWFCNKVSDPTHEREKATAWQKGQDCLRLMPVNCKDPTQCTGI